VFTLLNEVTINEDENNKPWLKNLKSNIEYWEGEKSKFSSVEEGIEILNELKINPEKMKEIAKIQYECLLHLWTYEKIAPQWKSLFNIGLNKARSSFQN
jgi:hypothetical protein